MAQHKRFAKLETRSTRLKLPIAKKPIYVKIGASRPFYDTALVVKAGADVVVLDGMQGGTAATQDVFIEHAGIPTLPAVRMAAVPHTTNPTVVGYRPSSDTCRSTKRSASAVPTCQARGEGMALGSTE